MTLVQAAYDAIAERYLEWSLECVGETDVSPTSPLPSS